MKTNNIATGIIGKIDGPEPANEADHFYICAKCKQAVDMRDLVQVFHHEDIDHEPIPTDS